LTEATDGSIIHPRGEEEQRGSRTVQVTFRTAQLERCYMEINQGTRRWGAAVARRYIQRILILHAAESIADLHATTVLRFHALTGDRAGQYSITLVGRARMAVTFSEDEKTVMVEEVSQHYGD